MTFKPEYFEESQKKKKKTTYLDWNVTGCFSNSFWVGFDDMDGSGLRGLIDNRPFFIFGLVLFLIRS